MRYAAIAAMVAVGGYVVAQQIVSPHRRAVKLSVLVGLMALMFRFDMVWSVYVFTMLFPFPSGISVGSTNSVLMTLIPLIWMVRATSTRSALFKRTPLDLPILVFFLIYIVSLINVDGDVALKASIRILWTQLTAIAFFYMIVNFVDNEEKLNRFAIVIAVACAFVMMTAVVELFFPGAVIIPGWIETAQQLGAGKLRYRAEGIRVGGAFKSHGMLADFGTQTMLFMIYFAIRARNPILKACWTGVSMMTLVAVLATANRGAGAGLALAVVLGLTFFGSRISFHKRVLAVLAVVALFLTAEFLMEKYTVASSLIDRFMATEFEGVVPETRQNTWKPALIRSMEHPFIGHGPYYDTTRGLEQALWPHNGYIFYLHSIGILGLAAFFWVLQRVASCSQIWRRKSIRKTRLGTLATLGQIWLLVLAFEQLRTDHQRDDIYPYILWMSFGFVVAGWHIIRKRLAEEEREAGATASPS